MTLLSRTDTEFIWRPEQQSTFAVLKEVFTSVPILAMFDLELDTLVETDVSDYVSAGILSQLNYHENLYPITYFTTKHPRAECNYEICDK